jgi:hypothetical protein
MAWKLLHALSLVRNDLVPPPDDPPVILVTSDRYREA